jgi:hypothetical protein
MRLEKTRNERILHDYSIVAKGVESSLHVAVKGEIVKCIDTLNLEWIHSVYDRYGGIIYAVLVDVCLTKADAGKVLVTTFKSLSTNESSWKENGINFISLVKFAILTARQHVSIKDPVCVNCFKQSTLLHYFICEDGTLEALCHKSGLPAADIARQVHLEILKIRTSKNNS